MKDTFVSGFAPDLENMIALKRALGYSENTYLETASRERLAELLLCTIISAR